LNAIRLTKAQQFWPLTDYLSGFGVPVGRYIERFRITKKLLDAPELFIDEARFWRLSADLANREGFPDWGFRAGQQLDFNVLGEFGEVLMRQPTLKIALETFVHTISAETQCPFGLMQQGDHTWLMMQGCKDAPAGRDIIELYDLAFLIKLVGNAVGSRWRPSAVHLQADALPDGLAASEICAGKIRYQSTMTAIAIPQALLAAPMSKYCPADSVESDVGTRSLIDTDFATSLRLLLTGHIDECPTIDECADMVGMSSRSLQRRLAEYGTSFNDLLDQTRFDLAQQLLADPSVRVTDIAVELGYQDPANFSRAFRRWAGVSPRQHRQSLLFREH
jgi:AraC-like DNA-binding protein